MFSIKMKTGPISYVNMFVFAVAVNHSPAIEIKSRPHDSWLKKCGWPIENFLITSIEEEPKNP